MNERTGKPFIVCLWFSVNVICFISQRFQNVYSFSSFIKKNRMWLTPLSVIKRLCAVFRMIKGQTLTLSRFFLFADLCRCADVGVDMSVCTNMC